MTPAFLIFRSGDGLPARERKLKKGQFYEKIQRFGIPAPVKGAKVPLQAGKLFRGDPLSQQRDRDSNLQKAKREVLIV